MRGSHALVVVDINPDAARLIAAAATRADPQETGGVLLGWWDADHGDHVVVRNAVEVPDPSATTHSWRREQSRAQAALDAALDDHQHPWLGYVGDWHSHPAPVGASRQDITSIRRASRQYPRPLVLIVHRCDGVLDLVAARQGRTRPTSTVPYP